MTKLEVANRALSILTSGTITNFDDTLDEKARSIKAIFDIAAREVMREHRWSCCIKRAELTASETSPTKVGYFGYQFSYPLPDDCLRFLDLNGEPYRPKSEFMDINGRELHTNAADARIRYVADMTADADVLLWDVSMAAAISVKIAMLVGRRITKDGMSYEDLFQLYQRELDTARKLDAMEVGSGENRPLNRMIESSPIINSSSRSGMSRAYEGGYGGGVNPPVDLENYYTKIECDARFAQQTALNLKADKTEVSNVDNTSDANKPVSTAQQAALDLKADLTALANLIPVSTIQYVAANVAPSGWLKANGAEVSRTTYSDLYAAIGDTYGAGDGSTTFLLPDLRGEFMRGWDDGRGVDAGRGFGSDQAGQIEAHNHATGHMENSQPFGSLPTERDVTGYIRRVADSYDRGSAATSSTGGTETRPRNVAMLAIIKT